MAFLLEKFKTATPTTKQPATKTDLKTVEGLKFEARKAGLEKEATKIVDSKGEDPERIFSGGFISDIFDGLNALQHGVTGVLQGKTFLEGIKTRASFTKNKALKEAGITGTIGGIALDIAVDPLTYAGGLGILKRGAKLVQVGAKAAGTKLGQKIPAAVKVGNALGRSFIYRFGQDPVYKQLAERATKNIAVGVRNMMDLVRPLTRLDGATQKTIANARKAGDLTQLPAEILVKAKPAFDELDKLGKEAVEVGLLKPEVYQANVGRYIARLYKSKEAPEGMLGKVRTFFDRKPLRIDLSRFKKRIDIPEDVREAMGEILEAGYPTAKSLVQLKTAIERAKFFGAVATKWGKEAAEEGFERLPDTKTLGQLAGKFVPQPIFDDIQELVRVKSPGERALNKVVAGFKFGKVILNPATHIRNVISNFILNNFEGLSPARIDIYGAAAREITRKAAGKSTKWYDEAIQAGLGADTFAAQELKAILRGPEMGTLSSTTRNLVNKLADLYQKEEEFAKLAQYIFQRGKGLSPEDALRVAEKATFNYAQVTPFIRRIRESIWGFPFITFTYKATPQVVKTLATKPTKISNIGKIKNAIENQSDLHELKAERATEPSWVKNGFYVKLPVRDKFGRSAYLDLTYILPFGDLVSGQFVERGISRETGLPESLPESALQKTPFLNLIKELAKNQDFYGNKIWRESDNTEKQVGDIMRHLMRTYLPPLISEQIPGGIRKSGERRPGTIQKLIEDRERGIEEGGMQGRTLMQELLRNVGVKIQPVDLELQKQFSESETKKALQTLLKERGVISDFNIPFKPQN